LRAITGRNVGLACGPSMHGAFGHALNSIQARKPACCVPYAVEDRKLMHSVMNTWVGSVHGQYAHPCTYPSEKLYAGLASGSLQAVAVKPPPHTHTHTHTRTHKHTGNSDEFYTKAAGPRGVLCVGGTGPPNAVGA
jgi:hypothetical protein